MIAFKAGVRLGKVTPSVTHILNCAGNVRDELGYPKTLVVTSLNDGSHSKNPPSRHYSDEAVDLRTKSGQKSTDMGTLAQKHRFERLLRAKLGSRFYVKLEFIGGVNEHIHAQTRRGHTYP